MKGTVDLLTEQQIDAVLGCLEALPWGASQMRCLDRFFRDTAEQAPEEAVVAARLAALDAMYGMNLWRRSNVTPQNVSDILLRDYAPRAELAIARICECGPSIHETLRVNALLDCQLRTVDGEKLAILADIHSTLRDLGRGTEPVAASKYLHFCYPLLFPIWDRKVEGLLRNHAGLLDGEAEFCGALLTWYKENLAAGWTSAIRNWEPRNRGTVTAVRSLDAVLWVVALAQGWTDEATVNREIHLFFREHRDVVELIQLHRH